ncbi:hypothetical protein [Ilumatobacter sp.]|uniref:hypothetical protein n=1 Tax=Ilumatobacter sp. TaxID=1967498 RepID=UPI003B52D5D1
MRPRSPGAAALRSTRAAVAIAVVVATVGAGCSGPEPAVDDEVVATLGELDDVVVTVDPDDLAGEPIVIGSVPPATGDVSPGRASTGDRSSGEGSSGQDGADGLVAGDAPTSADGSGDGLNPFGGDDPEDRRMPDVVCMILQDAQDEIQDRGVLLSRSEDATGAGRRQILDRNWVVVAQSPEPGVEIGERDALLSVVGRDETDDC